MRRNDKINTRITKQVARRKYAERQIDKWVKWSWRQRGKIKYKELLVTAMQELNKSSSFLKINNEGYNVKSDSLNFFEDINKIFLMNLKK